MTEVLIPLIRRRPGAAADLGWQDRALCLEVDPELFFPEKGGSTRDAKKVCGGCDVRAECLEYALTHPRSSEYGIWGGTSGKARRRMRKRAA